MCEKSFEERVKPRKKGVPVGSQAGHDVNRRVDSELPKEGVSSPLRVVWGL